MKVCSVALILVSLTPGIAAALEPEEIRADRVYATTKELNLRATPPRTLFRILGKNKGQIRAEKQITVRDVREVPTLTGKHYWLEVEAPDFTASGARAGWVYGGRKGSAATLEEVK